MMSETGVVDVKVTPNSYPYPTLTLSPNPNPYRKPVTPHQDEDVLWKGRLGPGLQITMDLETGEIRKNVEVKSANAARVRYGIWLVRVRGS